MQNLTGSSAQKGIAAVFSFIVTTVMAVVGAIFAIIFAGAVLIVGLMASVLIGLAAMAMGARRFARPRAAAAAANADSDVIEAQRVGGHSWVAYGWDGQRGA
jgi:Tfp pilus assembly protein PilX